MSDAVGNDEADSLLDDMLDQARDDEPEVKKTDVKEPVDITETVTATTWSLPIMKVDPNNVIQYEEDDSDPRNKKKNKPKEKQVKELTALEKLKQAYTKQWREELSKEIREELYEQASDEGYQHGFQKGLDESLKETEELQASLFSMVKSLQSPIELVGQEVEEQIELLSVTLAQQLVRREIKSNPGEIIGLIRESLKLLPASSRKIKISIHPEDAILFKEALSINDKDEDLNCTFIDDPMMTRGGCIISSEQSVINVTLENRLASLAGAVLSGNRSVDEPVASDQQKNENELSSVETETNNQPELDSSEIKDD